MNKLFLLLVSFMMTVLIGQSYAGGKEISGVYVSGKYQVTFMGGQTFRFVSPANGSEFSGTYTISGNTIIGDLGFKKQVYEILDENTLNTRFQGQSYALKKQTSSSGAGAGATGSRHSPIALSGTFSSGKYQVTFMGGQTFRSISPANGSEFSGTYKIVDNIVIGDYGMWKTTFEIVDAETLKTSFRGQPYVLKKR